MHAPFDSDPAETATSAAATTSDGALRSRSFLGLLVTQFLGAANDNMFRWLVVPIGKDLVGPERAGAALSVGLAAFVLPYLFLAAPAGYLSDRFSKRKVIVGCKVAEVVIMLLGVVAIWYGNVYFLFAVVFLMGAQSALFGPAKLGSIPEILRPERISAGNGVIGMTTIVAVVLGTIAGNWLFDAYDQATEAGAGGLMLPAAALLTVAVGGLLASLIIGRKPPADGQRRFPVNWFGQTYHDLRAVYRQRAMWRVVIGSAFFWSLASLAQLNVDLFGITELQLEQKQIGPLLAILSLGVGSGCVLAGLLSGGRVELGLVPLGALGISISATALFLPLGNSSAEYAWTCFWLAGLGLAAGFFDVPLAAYIQHRSPTASRGSVLAASNFLTFGGMIFVSLAFYLMEQQLELSARGIFLVAGCLTLPVAGYAFFLLPQATIRMLVWLATHSVYRVRVHQRHYLPQNSGALLLSNHVTWVDAVLLLVTSSRPVRLIVSESLLTNRFSRALARVMGAIPIRPTPQSWRNSMEAARRALARGELVCAFPEGSLTRSGHLQAFKRGVLEIVRDTPVPVIPVFLDELWGSIFSFHDGKFIWKRPRAWPYPVSIWFGPAVTAPHHIGKIRQAVQDLGAEAVHDRLSRSRLLPGRLLRQCRRKLFQSKAADSTGSDLTGGNLLMRTLILRRLLLREVLAEDEQHVGVLLPPSAGAVVVNAALALMRRVSVNLNYSLDAKSMASCVQQAGLRHVLTTRQVAEKLKIELDVEVIYLDDLREKLTTADKLAAAVGTYLVPSAVLERMLGLHRIDADDVLTVIFTSGSTGLPKGVQLTHRNILSNVEAIDQVVRLRSDDVLIGILPFFHSFGYTVTLWTVLGLNVKGAYHYSPLEPKQVGKLCHKHRGTVLLATPTFLKSYLRRCAEQEFASLEVVVVGAEKMPLELADAFEKKFGVRPVEGYGATELSPLVSVNVPPNRSLADADGRKDGSVGRPVPGVSVKTVDPETFEDLPAGEPGLLLVKGPNVMNGYLGLPEKTAEVLRDDWYVTGDVAQIDSDGFITLTGRQSRFSKIGGEMVPHMAVEEALLKLIGSDEVDAEQQLVVAGVPDERKGERLVVLYTDLPASPEQLRQSLMSSNLPNISIPAADSFYQVDQIPLLGSGKLDLRAISELAREKAGAHQAGAEPKSPSARN